MKRARDIAVLVLIAGVLWVCWDAHLFLTAATANSVDLSAILHRVNSQTGPITETDKLLLALKSTTVHADLVIAHEDKQLATYDGYVADIDRHIARTSEDVSGVAGAVTGTARSASVALGTLNTTIGDFRPVLGHLDASVQASTALLDTADSRLRDKRIDALLSHIEGMSASGDKMLADAQWKEYELLHPTPAKGAKAVIGGAILWLHRLEPPIF